MGRARASRESTKPAVTHYDTLEVGRHASPEVVKAAYRSLIQRFHPDRRPDDPDAAAKAAALTTAYEVLSDPARRAEYDQLLEAARAAAAPAPEAPRRASATASARARRASPAAESSPRWIWILFGLVLLGGAFWLFQPKRAKADDWAGLRQRFEASGQTEPQLRALIVRRDELLRQSPPLQAQMTAESARERAGRTLDLLDEPLVLQVGIGELTIPRVRLVLGSFDAPTLRSKLLANRDLYTREIVQRLTRTDPLRMVGASGDALFPSLIQDVMTKALATRPEEEYRSTWYESPGRYGVIEVQLPEGFRLRLPPGALGADPVEGGPP